MPRPIKVVNLEEDEHRPKKKGRIIKVSHEGKETIIKTAAPPTTVVTPTQDPKETEDRPRRILWLTRRERWTPGKAPGVGLGAAVVLATLALGLSRRKRNRRQGVTGENEGTQGQARLLARRGGWAPVPEGWARPFRDTRAEEHRRLRRARKEFAAALAGDDVSAAQQALADIRSIVAHAPPDSWYGSRASEGEDEAEEDEERELRLVLDYRDRILHDLEHADTEEGLLCALESVKCERPLLQSPPSPADPAPSDERILRQLVEGGQEKLCSMYEEEDRDYVAQLQHLRQQCGLLAQATAGHNHHTAQHNGRAAESRRALEYGAPPAPAVSEGAGVMRIEEVGMEEVADKTSETRREGEDKTSETEREGGESVTMSDGASTPLPLPLATAFDVSAGSPSISGDTAAPVVKEWSEEEGASLLGIVQESEGVQDGRRTGGESGPTVVPPSVARGTESVGHSGDGSGALAVFHSSSEVLHSSSEVLHSSSEGQVLLSHATGHGESMANVTSVMYFQSVVTRMGILESTLEKRRVERERHRRSAREQAERRRDTRRATLAQRLSDMTRQRDEDEKARETRALQSEALRRHRDHSFLVYLLACNVATLILAVTLATSAPASHPLWDLLWAVPYYDLIFGDCRAAAPTNPAAPTTNPDYSPRRVLFRPQGPGFQKRRGLFGQLGSGAWTRQLMGWVGGQFVSPSLACHVERSLTLAASLLAGLLLTWLLGCLGVEHRARVLVLLSAYCCRGPLLRLTGRGLWHLSPLVLLHLPLQLLLPLADNGRPFKGRRRLTYVLLPALSTATSLFCALSLIDPGDRTEAAERLAHAATALFGLRS